jgi:hypothetical protein
MLEQPRQQQDELTAKLQERIAALEQENAVLRAELGICQLELESQERILELISSVAQGFAKT